MKNKKRDCRHEALEGYKGVSDKTEIMVIKKQAAPAFFVDKEPE